MISPFPSPSRSETETTSGRTPTTRSTFGAKEILPTVLVFLNTETVFAELVLFVTTISGFPSPSISLIETLFGPDVVLRSMRLANEIAPATLVFLKTEI